MEGSTFLAHGEPAVARIRSRPQPSSGQSGMATAGSIATSGWVMKKTVGTEALPRAISSRYSAAASRLPGSLEVTTGYPSRRHQSRPPSSSLVRNPSRASLYAPLVDALQPIPSQ